MSVVDSSSVGNRSRLGEVKAEGRFGPQHPPRAWRALMCSRICVLRDLVHPHDGEEQRTQYSNKQPGDGGLSAIRSVVGT